MSEIVERAVRLAKANFIFLSLCAVIAVFGVLSEGFFSAASAQILLNQLPTLMVVTVGMVVVMLIGGIDLSVGSVAALSSAVVAVLVISFDLPLSLAILAGLIVGLALGFANGWLSTYAGLPSFIVTLGVLEAARGLAYLVTGSQTVYVGPSIEAIALPIAYLGVSPAFLIALLVVILGHIIVTRSITGKYLIAIGTREEAARAAGISTKPYKLGAFAVAGLLAGLGGVFNAAYLAAADPNAGSGLELSAIAAAVIGGTSLMGGRGSVIGCFVGVLLIATLQSGLAQMGASEPSKRIVTGLVIILAVLLDRWRQRHAN